MEKHTRFFKTQNILIGCVITLLVNEVAVSSVLTDQDLANAFLIEQGLKNETLTNIDFDDLKSLVESSTQKSNKLFGSDSGIQRSLLKAKNNAFDALSNKEFEGRQKALYENKETTFIAVSQTMGIERIKELMSLVSSYGPEAALIFKGINSDQTPLQFLQKMQLMASKFDPVPNVFFNSVIFRDFNINLVPSILVIANDEKNTFTNKKELLLKATGISNISWAYEQIDLGSRGDIGVHGETFEISEIDAIEVMKEKAAAHDWDKEAVDMKNRFWGKFASNYMDFPEVQSPRKRYFKPVVYAKEDLKDANGKVLIPKGSRENALKKRTFNQALFVFDATKENQIEWVLSKIKNDPSIKPLNVWLVATKFPTEGTDDGWLAYQQLTEKVNSHVYLIQQEIVESFFIEKIPTLVTANNQRHFFTIEEFGDEVLK